MCNFQIFLFFGAGILELYGVLEGNSGRWRGRDRPSESLEKNWGGEEPLRFGSKFVLDAGDMQFVSVMCRVFENRGMFSKNCLFGWKFVKTFQVYNTVVYIFSQNCFPPKEKWQKQNLCVMWYMPLSLVIFEPFPLLGGLFSGALEMHFLSPAFLLVNPKIFIFEALFLTGMWASNVSPVRLCLSFYRDF